MSSSDTDSSCPQAIAPEETKALESSENEGNDIMIDASKMNEFFAMDSDQEEKNYGASTKKMSAAVLKDSKQQEANKLKQIQDFKVRVLDFLSIFVREKKREGSEFDSMRLIKGLLKALQVAHQDKNTILFDRIKTVLAMIARGGQLDSKEDISAAKQRSKDRKILMTEVVRLVIKPTKDQKMHNAYVDCFITLTKAFCETEDMLKFVTFTYKELLQKFLGGRGAPIHALNQQFFTRIFEECDAKLGQALVKPLLRYLLPVQQSEKERKYSFDLGEKFTPTPEHSEASGAEGKEVKGSRSNQQRLMAIEIFGALIRASQKNAELQGVLAKNSAIISRVLATVVKTSDSWQQKKVKKTMLALNLYTKMAKAVKAPEMGESGRLLIKAIEAECEKDKSMSNLKGKVKEITHIIGAL